MATIFIFIGYNMGIHSEKMGYQQGRIELMQKLIKSAKDCEKRGNKLYIDPFSTGALTTTCFKSEIK